MNKAIEVRSSAKKQKTVGEKGSSFKLATIPQSVPIPPSSHAAKAWNVENIPFHGLEENVTILGDDSMPSEQTLSVAHINVHSQEELDIFLEHFSIFTNMEPPTSHMNGIFLILGRILVDVTIDPQKNFMAHVPHGTTDETIKAIMRLKDYTTMQTVKVV